MRGIMLPMPAEPPSPIDYATAEAIPKFIADFAKEIEDTVSNATTNIAAVRAVASELADAIKEQK